MMSLNEPDIKIIIVDDSRGEKCDAGCGTDWSSLEAIALASQRIRDRFGDRVKLDCVDLSQMANSHRASELKQRIRDLPLPLLLVNGAPRISGQFDIRQLLNAVDAEMEMNR